MTIVGLHVPDLSCLPDGRGFLLVELGGETKEEADARTRADGRPAQGHGAPKDMKLYDDPPRRSTSGRCARPASARPPSSRQARHLRGLGGLGGAARAPRRYLRDCARSPAGTVRERAATATTARAASTLAGTSTSRARRDRDLRRFLDEASDLVLSHGGSISASTATASRRPSCCRRCSATSSSAPSASSSRSGTRTGR
jgi:hypothetical protein